MNPCHRTLSGTFIELAVSKALEIVSRISEMKVQAASQWESGCDWGSEFQHQKTLQPWGLPAPWLSVSRICSFSHVVEWITLSLISCWFVFFSGITQCWEEGLYEQNKATEPQTGFELNGTVPASHQVSRWWR